MNLLEKQMNHNLFYFHLKTRTFSLYINLKYIDSVIDVLYE